jgi:hypothetical protein
MMNVAMRGGQPRFLGNSAGTADLKPVDRGLSFKK